MGEVVEKQSKGGGGGIVKKGKKLSTKVDMTPMVDLAFLLLTFFMLATTFIKPQVMQLILPEKSDPKTTQPKVTEKNVLSIVLDGKNKIYWYIGFLDATPIETNYSDTGLRKVLQDQTKANDKLVVLIKPEDSSTYENLVDTLDEMSINSVKTFVLAEFGDEDKAIMQKVTGGSV